MTLDSQNANRNQYVIALGANGSPEIGSNADLISNAVKMVNAYDLCVVASSRTYRTPAYPLGSGPDFANAVLLAESVLDPHEVLQLLHQIEAQAGRVRTQRWGQRVLDLDLIAAGGRVLPDAATFQRWLELPLNRQMSEAPQELILPHPRMQDRAFVLVPMAEVAPDWRHPVLGKTVAEMKNALPRSEIDGISPI